MVKGASKHSHAISIQFFEFPDSLLGQLASGSINLVPFGRNFRRDRVEDVTRGRWNQPIYAPCQLVQNQHALASQSICNCLLNYNRERRRRPTQSLPRLQCAKLIGFTLGFRLSGHSNRSRKMGRETVAPILERFKGVAECIPAGRKLAPVTLATLGTGVEPVWRGLDRWKLNPCKFDQRREAVKVKRALAKHRTGETPITADDRGPFFDRKRVLFAGGGVFPIRVELNAWDADEPNHPLKQFRSVPESVFDQLGPRVGGGVVGCHRLFLFG
ncbi:hypothetical protein [Stieleria magnilauensis]|uniref:hypothetical protein n=1 Tax=Stieleria magnilauensis TaxID=2527963 RepID=UPI003AF5491E